MNGSFQRRLRVLLGAAVTALICWKTIPGTGIERSAFTTVIRGFANPPFFISGNGSHATPWNLRTVASKSQIDSRQAPVIVSLSDDLEGYFQSSPHSPSDLAVIFTNFQRLGAPRAACAAVLAWDSPDPLGLMALDKAIARFDSLIMAAPLSRGAVPEPMPAAFRNASIPIDAIHGDVSLLPIVNRVSLSGIILGKKNTLAGFQTLDFGKTTARAPLMARWKDRIVFAFPLLVVLQRLELPLKGLEFRPGECLKLSPNGPIVPLDHYGRLAVPLKQIPPYAKFPAEELIDANDGFFPKHAPEPVILRDDRSAAEEATREFSETLPTIISTIASDTALAPPLAYPRLPSTAEIGYLSFVVILLTAICGLSVFARNIVLLVTAGIFTAAQCIAVGTAEVWLPGIPALAAILAAFALSHGVDKSPAIPDLIPIFPQPRPPMPSLEPEPAAIPQATEKTATKTPMAKKSAKQRKKNRK